ncbi:tigger transposable element-derived protein 6 [Trichonephila clavipes]|nr:tigger transposable element-derived protein 6 [Trichonephila clavipes]
MIDKAWRAVTPLTVHSCFQKSGFPSPNLVDVDDTLTEFNSEPSPWEAVPEQDLTFDDYVLVDTDIAVWGALSDAEIVALDHNNTKCDEDESEELTPVTLSEAKVSLNKLRNFFLQNHVDADILQASFVQEKSIDKVRLNALKQKKENRNFRQKKIKMSEDLSKFKKKRTAVRSSLTKLINKIEGKINNENEPVDQFEAFIEQLNDKESNLSLLNTLIEDRLSVDTITEDMEASEEIKEKIIFWKTKLSSKIRRINSDSIQVDTVSRNIQVIDSNSFEQNLGIEAEVSDEENIDNDIMSEFEAGISYQNKRYKVKFPWKPNMKTLENNEEIARKRFLKLRSRFKNDSFLFEDYKLVVNNYLSEKIIERVPFEEENLKHNIFIYHIEQ